MEKVKEVINKVEAKLSHNNDTTTTGTTTHGTAGHHTGGVSGQHGVTGPHDSNLGGTTTHGTAGHHTGGVSGQHGVTGPHDSNLGGTTTHGTAGHHTGGVSGQHGVAGPHDSNLANKIDPRVNSDMDNGGTAGVAQFGPGATSNSGLTGSHQTTGAGYGPGATSNSGLTGSHQTTGVDYGNSSNTSTNNGPHNSNLANKMDPRVDSDMDNSHNAGAAQFGPGATSSSGLAGSHQTGGAGYGSSNSGLPGSHQTTGVGYGSSNSGLTGSHQTAGAGYGSSNSGPHSNNLANKLDPRVTSNLNDSRTASGAEYGNSGISGSTDTGYGSTGNGFAGSTGAYGNDSLASHQQQGGQTGHRLDGPAPNTAGPHRSDALNKMDPRIDSDRDGSKTVGGNPQY